MAAIFQFGFRPAQPWPEEHRLDDIRWSLAALDPQSHVRCGVFQASDGANLPYRFWRANEPRALLLLLHGACDYSGAFDEIAPKLAQRGFSCLAYDQRGFGATATRGNWAGSERLAEDAANAAAFLRRRVDAELPLFILGESMGGAVAVHAAARYRSLKADGLVLVAPGALASAIRRVFYDWTTRLIRFWKRNCELVFERVSGWELTPSAAIRLMGDPLVMNGIKPEIFTGLVALGYNAVKEARNVTAPTLTLVAGKDDLLRKACIGSLHGNLGGDKSWLEFAGAPHMLLHWRDGESVLREATHWMLGRLMMRPKKVTNVTPEAACGDCGPAPSAASARRPRLPARQPA
ncbi:MAG TPA: alpha/beta fold hydrolase [Rhizomicrobium sp.]|jgi:alpha-beta hydrolase superfamily lysophospholipase